MLNIALCKKKKTKIFQSLKEVEDQMQRKGINIGFAIACKPTFLTISKRESAKNQVRLCLENQDWQANLRLNLPRMNFQIKKYPFVIVLADSQRLTVNNQQLQAGLFLGVP
ncbi:hypothetical protein JYQ62_31585 [Nostoc sp. UHCC 0702]|nr:hypothetical protein JYQ62_31585 [Nostoc sp. UHCC 0702]